MKCGDLGFTNAAGAPCGQNIAADATGCLWHSRTAEERSLLATKGAIASKMKKALPADYAMRPFDSRDSVIQFAQDLAYRVLTQDVDPRRIDTALRAAQVALSGFAAATQEKLVDALLRIEHGGAAMMLLTRLQEGLTERRTRPLPGVRVLRATAAEGEVS